MMAAQQSLAIVDTGCANLASVGFAIDRLGNSLKVEKTVTADPARIQAADKVILPGVGAMPFAMKKLQERGLVEVLQNLTQPVLGICLGMQMMFETSDEGNAAGLGVLPGGVKEMQAGTKPLPHMGWNQLEILSEDPILNGINSGDYVYFVHSYAVPVGAQTLATSNYENPFSAVVRKDNYYGCQFHPERSAHIGAKILENFLKLKTG